jgi:hypothetical protein
MTPRRRSRATRRLRQALLVWVLLDAAVLATEAAAPAARRRLLAEEAPASLAVAATGCTGESKKLAPAQCAAWGQF